MINVVVLASIAVALGAVVAVIAQAKGRRLLPWAIYGTGLGPLALVHVLLARNLTNERRWSPERFGLPARERHCPNCWMMVHEAALVCRHCRRTLDPCLRFDDDLQRDMLTRKAASAATTAGFRAAPVTWTLPSVPAGMQPWQMFTVSNRVTLETPPNKSVFHDRAVSPASATDHGLGPPATARRGTRPVSGRRERADLRQFEEPHRVAGVTRTPMAAPERDRTKTREREMQRFPGGRRVTASPRAAAVALGALCVVGLVSITPVRQAFTRAIDLVSPAELSGGDAGVIGNLAGETANGASSPSDARSTPTAGADDPTRKVVEAVVRPDAEADNLADVPSVVSADTSRDDKTDAPNALPSATSPLPESWYAPVRPRVKPAALSTRPQVAADTEQLRNFEEAVARLKSAPQGQRARFDQGNEGSAVGSVVEQLQVKLKSMGFDPGAADGKLGPRTRQALRDFQRDADLPPTGEIDNAVLIAFGINS